jgi:hypothetical protein
MVETRHRLFPTELTVKNDEPDTSVLKIFFTVFRFPLKLIAVHIIDEENPDITSAFSNRFIV